VAPCTSKLRRKNRLSRAGRTEEANALARRVGKDIAARNRTRLSRINHKKCATDMWAAVRQLTGRRHKDEVCNGITAETLNQHYARISTDSAYQRQPRKLTATHREVDFVSEWQLFSILDTLPPTATGLDHLPAWFIRLGAPVFSKPLAHLFNKSLSTPTVPLQWKYTRPQDCFPPRP